ncbi:hypothetical protein HPB47_008948 [Ixodes persulcatus]|uniref:Uncharacterized protein n=1 Tax=Ixodes persulcatus TaxID=34615 RepID=A0AC60P3I2_IXOPE|nr:hypothetical protein HPB47_008948 [Ixodes persulcatus]
MEDIIQAAHLTPTEIKETIMRTRNNQNISAIPTFRPSAHDKVIQFTQIAIQGNAHFVACYPSAPTNSCKGGTHGIPALTSSPQLLEKLVSPGPEILTARVMGKTKRQRSLRLMVPMYSSTYSKTKPNTAAGHTNHGFNCAAFALRLGTELMYV